MLLFTFLVVNGDITITGKFIGDISSEIFNDLSASHYDLSATFYDLSDVVAKNVVDISDISGLVLDLSMNFHDLSATFYDLSDVVAKNVVTSAIFRAWSWTCPRISTTCLRLSRLDVVTKNVVDISDISGLVLDLSTNFHDLSATFYDLSDVVTKNVVDIHFGVGLGPVHEFPRPVCDFLRPFGRGDKERGGLATFRAWS